MGRLQVGRVARAHGVRGELRVRVSSESFATLSRLLIGAREFVVRAMRPERDDFLVLLEGVHTRDEADLLRGQFIFADRAALPALGEGEFYVDDLVGCEVFDSAGARLGTVTSVFHSGAHEVMVIKGATEFMLPLVDAMVRAVDVKARRVVCDPPPGLVDLKDAE